MISYICFTTFLREDILITVIKVSMIIGAAFLLIFGVILAIEMRQDRRINRQYNRTRHQKIQIAADVYECQNCGSRNVKSEDAWCRDCGIKFSRQ